MNLKVFHDMIGLTINKEIRCAKRFGAKQTGGADQMIYRFSVWNDLDIRGLLRELLELPTHEN